MNVFEFGWSGSKVAAVCTDEPSESAWYDAWIGLIDIEARSVERIHTPEWQLQCPVVSPGGRVAWIEGFASDRGVVTGTVTRPRRRPARGRAGHHVDRVRRRGDALVRRLARRRLDVRTARAGRVGIEDIAAGDMLFGARFQPRVTPHPDGSSVATVFESSNAAPEIGFFERDGEARELTSLNGELAAELPSAEWRTYAWDSFDGLEIDGLLALPPDHEQRRAADGRVRPRRPDVDVVVELPAAPHAMLLQEGYAVFLPNPRGSSGRGQEFARANLGDMGGGDFKDILAGVDALVRDGIADDARVAITGGSYGGFMSSWAVTQTDRFAAAMPFAVVTDWTSFHYTTNIGQFDVLFLQGDPDRSSRPVPKRSPVFHAEKCKTPTLILHGEDDLCTPLPQATEFYNALVEAGCEVELVIYPREGHGWTEREHQIDAWNRVQAWLEQHVKNRA